MAYIPRAKLKGYLLSDSHPVGKAKARFFHRFGYDESTIERLESDFINIAQSHDVTEVATTAHGTKYIMDGFLNTPIGRQVLVRTVWIVDAGQDRPRFVTAHPTR